MATSVDLARYRCATCGGRVAPGTYQPSVDPRFPSGACYGCSPDESKVVDVRGLRRVAIYELCEEVAEIADRGKIGQHAILCRLASGHEGPHSPTFVRATRKRRPKPDTLPLFGKEPRP